MTEEQIEHARKFFAEFIKDHNKKTGYKLSLQKTKDGYAYFETHSKWKAFLAGYNAALEQSK